MATTTHHQRAGAFHGFEHLLERKLGADMRLLYGMAVPVLGVCIIMAVALGLAASVVVDALLMVLLLGCGAVVIYGFMGVLEEDDPDDELTAPR